MTGPVSISHGGRRCELGDVGSDIAPAEAKFPGSSAYRLKSSSIPSRASVISPSAIFNRAAGILPRRSSSEAHDDVPGAASVDAGNPGRRSAARGERVIQTRIGSSDLVVVLVRIAEDCAGAGIITGVFAAAGRARGGGAAGFASANVLSELAAD